MSKFWNFLLQIFSFILSKWRNHYNSLLDKPSLEVFNCILFLSSTAEILSSGTTLHSNLAIQALFLSSLIKQSSLIGEANSTSWAEINLPFATHTLAPIVSPRQHNFSTTSTVYLWVSTFPYCIFFLTYEGLIFRLTFFLFFTTLSKEAKNFQGRSQLYSKLQNENFLPQALPASSPLSISFALLTFTLSTFDTNAPSQAFRLPFKSIWTLKWSNA